VKLKKDSTRLEILGDVAQKKSYLDISDTVEATMHLFNVFRESGRIFDVYNIGNEDRITVKEIAEIVLEGLGLEPEFHFTSGVKGGRGR